MNYRFSEYVSPGHPDKVADYISEYLLDRYLEQDPATRYAVEVLIKGTQVTLAGEVTSRADFSDEEITSFVKEAVRRIGYTQAYQDKWGRENTISAEDLAVTKHIEQQSPEIAMGVNRNAWGDQGVFYAYACPEEENFGMTKEYALAKRLNHELFVSGLGGLDIKTEVILDGDKVHEVIAAVPTIGDDTEPIKQLIYQVIPGEYKLVVNGTGVYHQHGPVADTGVTGRKLAVDFGAGRIGGGCPWTKDATKADLSLNLYARRLAKVASEGAHEPVEVSIACCIGKPDIILTTKFLKSGEITSSDDLKMSPRMVKEMFGLDKPVYADMCWYGPFGEYQQDKPWEKSISDM